MVDGAIATVETGKISRKRRAPVSEQERQLVKDCQRGDHRSMQALYHRYKRRVFSLCIRIAGPTDGEEVAQEAFVRIFRGISRFRGDSALGTWIYRLTVNAALSHVTRRPKPTEGEEALLRVPADLGPQRDPKLAIRLQMALAKLPPGYRAVMVLHDVEGFSHDEVADILGCRVGTSKSQLFKARARMRVLLGGTP